MIMNDEIYHSGIKGMKWGVRNGPPYPLHRSQMSAAERKASGTKTKKRGRLKLFKTIRLESRGHTEAELARDLRIAKSDAKHIKSRGYDGLNAFSESRVKRLTKRYNTYKAKTDAIVKKYKAQGLTVESKTVERLANLGSWATIDMFDGNDDNVADMYWFATTFLMSDKNPRYGFAPGRSFRVRKQR